MADDLTAYVSELSSILSAESPNSILLITGGKSYTESGAEKLIGCCLSQYNVIHYFKNENRFTVDHTEIDSLLNRYKSTAIELVLAVGGGTVLDLAKAFALLKGSGQRTEDAIFTGVDPNARSVPKLLVPTTGGTGSESTPFSAIYINGIKHSMAHKAMSAEYFLLIPELLLSLSGRIAASTGFDALSQSIESYWSILSNAQSRDYSRCGITLAMENLLEAVTGSGLEPRRNMLNAANFSGKAIAIARTTAAHALSYPLTANFNIPHGHAVMLTLPHFFVINALADEQNIQQSARLQDVRTRQSELISLLECQTPYQARDLLLKLMSDCGMETRLRDLKVPREKLNLVMEQGFNPQRINNNPVIVSKSMVNELLQEIW